MWGVISSPHEVTDTARRVLNVVHNGIGRGHQDEGDGCGEQDAVSQRDGHGDEEPGLARGLKDHGGQSSESRERGQHDRTEAPDACGMNGLARTCWQTGGPALGAARRLLALVGCEQPRICWCIKQTTEKVKEVLLEADVQCEPMYNGDTTKNKDNVANKNDTGAAENEQSTL